MVLKKFFVYAVMALSMFGVSIGNEIKCFQCNIGFEFDPIPNCTSPAIVKCASTYSKELCYSALVKSKRTGAQTHVKACTHSTIGASQTVCEEISKTIPPVVKIDELEFVSCATCDRDLCNVMGRGDIFLSNYCTKIKPIKTVLIIFMFLHTIIS